MITLCERGGRGGLIVPATLGRVGVVVVGVIKSSCSSEYGASSNPSRRRRREMLTPHHYHYLSLSSP